ncbi:hypothetical protein PAPYR_11449 [Paratrimastix pyriformis]|uniref:Uncharacterized protein n=1 Tax=Paratrimastix pyriformis TaxID=342808 RepID=A0ABQ8UAV7_9EUKA|nr:hypothetical protein PAPYR_11449 [Paratrimastix pyriformis]
MFAHITAFLSSLFAPRKRLCGRAIHIRMKPAGTFDDHTPKYYVELLTPDGHVSHACYATQRTVVEPVHDGDRR